jgi:hypothetical protein
MSTSGEAEIEGGIVDGVEIDWFDMWVSVPGLTCCDGSIFWRLVVWMMCDLCWIFLVESLVINLD